MDNNITKLISYFLETAKDKPLLITADFSVRNESISLFGLNEISYPAKIHKFSDYFEMVDSKTYNLIVAELPFGLKPTKNKQLNLSIPENWNMLYQLLTRLSDVGVALVGLEPSFGSSLKSRTLLEAINKMSIFLNALIETPKNILNPLTALQPTIAIFSKQDNQNKIFIASLNENDDPRKLFENFGNRKANSNLVEGDIVSLDKFKGFFNYQIEQKINAIKTQYKDFEKKYLSEIATDIKTTREMFEEEDNSEYLYIPQIGSLTVFSDSKKLDKKHQNFFQVRVNEKIVRSEYLKQYFRSNLGQLSLKSLLANTFIPRINKSELEKLAIPLPPLSVQEKIISSYDLLNNVSTVMSKLEMDLSLNPKNADEIIERLTDTLVSLNELSKADEVFSYIRQGESLTVEFKQTFSIDIKSGKKEKYIEDSALKNIAGFLNREGGVLLIGISDDGEIVGINNDNYQSDDNYLLHFKNKIKTSIGEEYFALINYEIVDIYDQKILVAKCKPSNKPVYMYGKDFYVRTNPATDKLEGPKLVEYIINHFK